MQRIERGYRRLLEVFAAAACALILGMTLMICADVFLRNVRDLMASTSKLLAQTIPNLFYGTAHNGRDGQESALYDGYSHNF